MARDVGPSNVVPMQRSGGGSGSGDDGNYGERLARIESKMGHMATREDVQEVKTLIERKESTMLRWLLGMLVVALVSLGVALFRTFL